MYITKISVDKSNPGLFENVLRELVDICEQFTCYSKEMVVICQDEINGVARLYKYFSDLMYNTDDLAMNAIVSPSQR